MFCSREKMEEKGEKRRGKRRGEGFNQFTAIRERESNRETFSSTVIDQKTMNSVIKILFFLCGSFWKIVKVRILRYIYIYIKERKEKKTEKRNRKKNQRDAKLFQSY